MKLTHIEATGLKGEPFAYDLSSAVAIVGPNFTGKTRVIDAIRLVLLGYLPELGKTNRATWGLASGSEMIVRAQFDIEAEPKVIKHGMRRFWLEGGTVKDELKPDPYFDFTQFQANPLLNASLYFSMSERERANYVFGVIPLPASLSVDGIISRLERISFEEDHTEAIENAKRDIIKRVHKNFDQSGDLAGSIGVTIEELKANFSAYNKRAKDTIGAVRVVTELKNREGEFAAVSNLDKEIEDARKALTEANQANGAVVQRVNDAIEYAKANTRVSFGDTNTEFEDQIKKLETLIDEAKATLKPDLPIASDLVEHSKNHQGLINKQSVSVSHLATYEKQEKAFKDMKECPTCGAKGKDWKKKAMAGLAKSIKNCRANLADLDKQLRASRTEIDAKTARNNAASSANMTNSRLKENIQKWSNDLATVRGRQAAWSKTLDKLRADLAAMPKPEGPKQPEIEAVERAVTICMERLRKVETQKRDYERYQQDVQRAAQASIEHNEAKARLAVVKAVGAAMQDIKAEVVETAFTELLRVANGIVGDVLKTPLAFFGGEVGRWDGPKFIGHGTFSGTEQALTFVAIAAALSQRSPLRLLIFDELGRLDALRQNSVVALLNKALKEGHIDQFIVAGAIGRQPLSAEPIQIIELK